MIRPLGNRAGSLAHAVAAAVVLVASVAKCLGPTPDAARQKVDDALASFELSSTNVWLSPKVAAAFKSLDQSMLVPSAIYADSSKWTAFGPDTRTLAVHGAFRDGRYEAEADSTAPVDLGASRRIVRLQRTSRQQYRWTAIVEQALGSVAVEDIERVVRTILGEAAQMTGAAIRAAEASRYPRASAVLSRLFSLDSLTTKREALRTRVRMVVGVHLARLAATYPHYATALRTTAEPTQVHSVATDDRNAEWLRVDFADGRFAMEIAATPAGHLAPLNGPPRAVPDSLILRMDYSTKMSSLFSVGVRGLVSRVALLDRPHIYGARLVFTQEPQWDFPLALDRLVTTTLARPFADSGGRYEILVTDTAGAQTEFQQSYAFNVEESPILRWLDRVNEQFNNAFSDSATADANAYFASLLAATRADIRAESALATEQHSP